MNLNPAYRQPYRPLIVRDILADCDISYRELGAAVGISCITMQVMATRGYIPRIKTGVRDRIQSFLGIIPAAKDWLKDNRVRMADIWRPSANGERHRYPAGHRRRTLAGIQGGRGIARPGRLWRQLKKQIKRRKQIMENGFATLAQFGYRTIPFADVRIPTADASTLKRLFRMTVESTAMVQVIAPYGAGKSTAIDAALDGLDAATVQLKLADKERMTIADIERELIRQLSTEPVVRDRGARARQVSRIVGETARQRPVMLLIEESHCMHHSTLRALKRIREYDWMGRKPLLSVILIGQFDKLKTAGLAECHKGIRSDVYRLQGLAPSEARHYITETVGEHFEAEAVKATAELQEARNFLDLQECIITLMQAALAGGVKMVSIMDVFSTYGGGLKQLMERYEIKSSQLAEMIGESATTVSLLINNKPHTLSKEKEASARSAIADALRTLTQEHSAKKTALKAV